MNIRKHFNAKILFMVRLYRVNSPLLKQNGEGTRVQAETKFGCRFDVCRCGTKNSIVTAFLIGEMSSSRISQ